MYQVRGVKAGVNVKLYAYVTIVREHVVEGEGLRRRVVSSQNPGPRGGPK